MRIGQSMMPEFDMEMANTRKVLERIPEDKLDWKIHARSSTIGWVANHLADIPRWIDLALSRNTLDIEPVGGERYQSPSETAAAAILSLFDKNVARGRELLDAVEDSALHATWRLQKQGETLLTFPRIVVIRSWVLNHSIHHRAHLCVYLRVHGIPVPALYGPSADEGEM